MDWKVYVIQGMELLFLGIGSYFDLKNRELPVRLFGIFGVLGLVFQMIFKVQSAGNIVMGVCFGCFFLLVGKATQEAIGYGDGLGFCVLAIFEGIRGLFFLAFGAFCMSAVYGVWKMLILKQGVRDTMAFYPFLLLAWMGVIVL